MTDASIEIDALRKTVVETATDLNEAYRLIDLWAKAISGTETEAKVIKAAIDKQPDAIELVSLMASVAKKLERRAKNVKKQNRTTAKVEPNGNESSPSALQQKSSHTSEPSPPSTIP